MAMHGVGFTLMSKEAGSRGKAGVFARIDLASVGLQVGVHEFAEIWVKEAKPKNESQGELTRSCT